MKATTCGLFAIMLLWFFPAPACSSYSYQDINPSGWIESRAVCVNDQGDVAGYGNNGSGERGFLWSSGDVTEILPPGAASARANWINGRGDVAGTAVIDGQPHAFLYTGGMYVDPTPGWTYSEATHVGEDGSVTGTGEFGAFISRNGVPELLPGFNTVVGANASGQILGISGGTARLFLPGTGYIILSPPGCSSVIPRGLNESGLVAVSSRHSNTEKGYVYSGGFYVFMTPQGWTSSNAMGINNASQVAGYGDSPAGRRGFVRTGSTYEELWFPGWNSTEAISINESAQVAGSGETGSGETHAFLSSPVSASAGESAGASSGGMGGGGGGCTVAGRDARGTFSCSSAANLLVLLFPLFILRHSCRKVRILDRHAGRDSRSR
ncbi:MAG: hypothetical protein HY896_04105 [Deltaproteobacteria bacterium]|nr:hypothetical protein [Deltaproteobacteria bacterium]